jgi:hypothetical protein
MRNDDSVVRECFSLLNKPGFNPELLKRWVKTPDEEGLSVVWACFPLPYKLGLNADQKRGKDLMMNDDSGVWECFSAIKDIIEVRIDEKRG